MFAHSTRPVDVVDHLQQVVVVVPVDGQEMKLSM